VLGDALPPLLDDVAAYKANLPRGFVVNAASPAPISGPPTLTLTQFPAPGKLTAIAGTVTGVANPGDYKVILYMKVRQRCGALLHFAGALLLSNITNYLLCRMYQEGFGSNTNCSRLTLWV
jgi:hypothetical protein